MTRVAALIRCGQICTRCTGKKCAEDLKEIEIPCPACEAMGCDECGDYGYFPLDVCPQVFVRPIVAAVQLADIWKKKNAMPVAGGTLDQSASWLDFCDRLEHEELNIRNGK